MGVKIAVLLSIGKHPTSGREVRSASDAAALAKAMELTPDPIAIHAGDPNSEVLREYLSMGLKRLVVLPIKPGEACGNALTAYLNEIGPDAIFTGDRSEGNEGTGLIPYLLASRLGAALTPGVVSAAVAEGASGLMVEQSPKRSYRRRLRTPLPAVISFSKDAAQPTRFSWAQGQRGEIEVWKGRWSTKGPMARPDITMQAYQPKPKRLAPAGSNTQGDGQVLMNPAPHDAAAAILDYLKRNEILKTKPDGQT